MLAIAAIASLAVRAQNLDQAFVTDYNRISWTAHRVVVEEGAITAAVLAPPLEKRSSLGSTITKPSSLASPPPSAASFYYPSSAASFAVSSVVALGKYTQTASSRPMARLRQWVPVVHGLVVRHEVAAKEDTGRFPIARLAAKVRSWVRQEASYPRHPSTKEVEGVIPISARRRRLQGRIVCGTLN